MTLMHWHAYRTSVSNIISHLCFDVIMIPFAYSNIISTVVILKTSHNFQFFTIFKFIYFHALLTCFSYYTIFLLSHRNVSLKHILHFSKLEQKRNLNLLLFQQCYPKLLFVSGIYKDLMQCARPYVDFAIKTKNSKRKLFGVTLFTIKFLQC